MTTGRPTLIDGLLRPDAYPHLVDAPVRIVETHISWVLLAGRHAYKIKKPLRLSFLDYSTLARRKFCCEEELRLNRRYAPALYLAAVPIGGAPDAPRVGDESTPAQEYAVSMLRFDTREELDSLVASGTVQPHELAALGHDVGRFHHAAGRAAADADFGSADRVQRVTRDNFAEIERLGTQSDTRARLDVVRSTIDTTFAALAPAIERRRRDGWVRECHGDLHCANVVRWQGRLTPFDGIEFDPGLRYVDVANDVAFLTMDLSARRRDDLRHAALNGWAESLGDYGGVELLPYYETYRALVRAKVAALRAGQAGRDSIARAAAVAETIRYLDWAVARAGRPRPQLIMTCGLSGSGKTWLARQVLTQLRAIHLRSDVERKRLAGLGPLADSRSPPDAGIYTREFNSRTYDRLTEAARSCLRGGENVLVDAAFLRRAERRTLLNVAVDLGADARILHCVAPLAELKRRVAERRAAMADPSEADPALLDRQPSFWEPLDTDEQAITIEVDTTEPHAPGLALERLQAHQR